MVFSQAVPRPRKHVDAWGDDCDYCPHKWCVLWYVYCDMQLWETVYSWTPQEKLSGFSQQRPSPFIGDSRGRFTEWNWSRGNMCRLSNESYPRFCVTVYCCPKLVKSVHIQSSSTMKLIRGFFVPFRIIFIPLFRPSLEKKFCLQTEASLTIIFDSGYYWYFSHFSMVNIWVILFWVINSHSTDTRVIRTNSTSFSILGLCQRGRRTNWPNTDFKLTQYMQFLKSSQRPAGKKIFFPGRMFSLTKTERANKEAHDRPHTAERKFPRKSRSEKSFINFHNVYLVSVKHCLWLVYSVVLLPRYTEKSNLHGNEMVVTWAYAYFAYYAAVELVWTFRKFCKHARKMLSGELTVEKYRKNVRPNDCWGNEMFWASKKRKNSKQHWKGHPGIVFMREKLGPWKQFTGAAKRPNESPWASTVKYARS